MAQYEDMFQKWFSSILVNLTKNPDAGAVLLMVSFPLLESYLRKKCKMGDKEHSLPQDSRFFVELHKLFPPLHSPCEAWEFWRIYRHGLLHLARLNRQGDGWRVGEQAEAVKIDGGHFNVDPVKFAECVLREITSHLEEFQRGEHLGVFPGGTGTIQSSPVTEYQDRYKIDKP